MSPIRKGFTLIEVAVVLVVLAILAAIAIPSFNTFMNGVDERAARTTLEGVIADVTANSTLDDGKMYPLQTGLAGCQEGGAQKLIWRQVIGYDNGNPADFLAGELPLSAEGNFIVQEYNDTCGDIDGAGPATGSDTQMTLFELAVTGSRASYYATIDINTGDITRFETTPNPIWDTL